MPYGTLTVLDDLESVNTTVQDFGQVDLAERINQALDIHNRALQEAIGDFVFFTSAPQLPYGNAEHVEVVELDEFGSADASKVTGGGNIGFPLRLYGSAVQWTRMSLQRLTVADLATQADAHAAADVRNVHRQFRRALFRPTNATYTDVNDTGLQLSLKALLNADGSFVPVGPNGEEFNAGTHTHFLANASLTEAKLQETIDTVVEHGVTGEVRIYINRAQEATIRGFDGFDAFAPPNVEMGANARFATGQTTDYRDPNNRAVGLYEGATVYVKPWIPANYVWVFDTGAGGRDKVLAVRTRTGSFSGLGAFGIVAEHEHYPLQARQMAREFGVSVWQRHKAAILFTNGASYTAPTL